MILGCTLFAQNALSKDVTLPKKVPVPVPRPKPKTFPYLLWKKDLPERFNEQDRFELLTVSKSANHNYVIYWHDRDENKVVLTTPKKSKSIINLTTKSIRAFGLQSGKPIILSQLSSGKIRFERYNSKFRRFAHSDYKQDQFIDLFDEIKHVETVFPYFFITDYESSYRIHKWGDLKAYKSSVYPIDSNGTVNVENLNESEVMFTHSKGASASLELDEEAYAYIAYVKPLSLDRVILVIEEAIISEDEDIPNMARYKILNLNIKSGDVSTIHSFELPYLDETTRKFWYQDSKLLMADWYVDESILAVYKILDFKVGQ